MTGRPIGDGDTGAPTPWQRHMWLSQLVSSDRVDLNVGGAVHISGPLDVEALDAAIRRVASANPLLRTRFPAGATGLPRRSIDRVAQGPHRVPVHDDRAPDADDPQVRLRVRRLFHHVFDLVHEVPMRSELIDVGAHGHVLAVVAHRMICDEAGIDWWFDRVAAAYRSHGLWAEAADVTLRPDPARCAGAEPADATPIAPTAVSEIGRYRTRLSAVPVFPGEDAVRTGDGRSAIVPIPVTARTLRKLSKLCAGSELTMPVVAAAAAVIAIARICGFREFPIDVSLPTAGRSTPGTPPNTVRCAVGRLDTVTCAIRSVGRALSAPPVGPDSSGPYIPRVRAIHHGGTAPDFAGTTTTRVLTTDTEHSAYPLTVDIRTDLRLVHDPAVVSGRLAAAIAEAITTILDALADGSTVPVVDLPIMRTASRDAVLARSHGRAAPDRPTTVLDAIGVRCRADPDAAAVVDDGVALSRAEIDRRSLVVADRLRRTGVRVGDVVATLVDPSADMVVAALAILRVGAVFLPTDRNGGAVPLRGVLDRTRPVAVVAESASDLPAIAGWAPAVVSPIVSADAPPGRPELDVAPYADQPAYLVPARAHEVRPRMVMISHSALAQYVAWLGRLVNLQPDESVLQVAPPGFDVGIAEIFGCLTAGIRLVIPNAGRFGDAGYLTDLIDRYRVATMHVVPSQLVNLLAERSVDRWTTLRCIPVGGEPFPARLANRFTAAFDATLHNFYGVTEMTLAAGHHEVTADSGRGTVPIGRPKDNSRILILDERLQPVPDGVVGDIYVGGSQLAIGYFRLPAPTAARFVADPFEPGRRLFHTGDRGRWTEAGLDYYGGADRIVVRGNSVERRDVERVVAEVLDARAAIVDVVGARGVLVAWAVGAAGDDDAALESARTRLATILPDHLVPSVVVAIDRIPLTSTGTIDRAALPIPNRPADPTGRPPHTRSEKRVGTVVAEVSGNGPVHPDHAVAELCWGPVVAAELACRLSAEFGIRVTAAEVQRWSTPAAIAAGIDTEILTAAIDANARSAGSAVMMEREAEMTTDEPTLVVVGAGPKGVAVATKAAVLREMGLAAPRVILVERRGIGANWTLAGGWTDGSQRLGTSPEKDLGFPYRSAEFRGLNRHIDQAAQRFSWSAYLIAAGTFGEWVDRGRPAPRHREWARYLQWAAESAEAEVVSGEVTALSIADHRWRIGLGDGEALEADAVMVTGPGSAISDWETLGPRVVGPASFWRAVAQHSIPSGVRAAVIGAGETAGAILHEMSRQDVAGISVIAPRASLFTRGEGYFENRVFTDSERWESLSINQRREVIERADRGVLSTRVMDEIRLDGRIAHLEGRVRSARTAADGIRLGIDTAAGPIERDFGWVIDARGTRDLWMLDLLDADARDRLERAIGGPASLDRMQLSVGRDLAVEGLYPQLFTPSLAALRQGPGFPNLSCLGLLSDRICAGVTGTRVSNDAKNSRDAAAAPLASEERRQGWTLV